MELILFALVTSIIFVGITCLIGSISLAKNKLVNNVNTLH